MTKNLLILTTLSHQELQGIIDRAISLKKEHKVAR